jgi:hypothetical protein
MSCVELVLLTKRLPDSRRTKAVSASVFVMAIEIQSPLCEPLLCNLALMALSFTSFSMDWNFAASSDDMLMTEVNKT